MNDQATHFAARWQGDMVSSSRSRTESAEPGAADFPLARTIASPHLGVSHDLAEPPFDPYDRALGGPGGALAKPRGLAMVTRPFASVSRR